MSSPLFVDYDNINKKLKVTFPFDPLVLEFIQKSPERTWSATQMCWVIPPVAYNILYLEKYPNLQLTDKAKIVFSRIHDDLKEQEDYIKRVESGEISNVVYMGGFVPHTKPFAHQIESFNCAHNRQAFALFLEPGLGKTKVAIDLACYYIASNQIDKVFVLCPSFIKSVWEREINLHAPNAMPVVVINGSDGKKRYQMMDYAIKKKNVWLITNYEELITIFQAHFQKYMDSGRVLIIADESTKIKNRAAKQSKIAISLSSKATKRLIMTGTPIANSPLDFWSQFRFLQVDLGFSNFFQFRNRYGILGGYMNKQVIKYQNLAELQQKVRGFSIRKTKAECLDLPPKLYQEIAITLPKELKDAYERFRQELYLELTSEHTTSPGEIAAPNVLAKLVRLSQITGSTMKLEDGTHTRFKATPKLDALEELLDDLGEQQVIVWAQFVGEMHLIGDRLKELGITYSLNYGDTKPDDRARQIEDFQHGKTRVFVAHPKALGMGVTLTAARYAIFYSNGYSYEARYQAEDRCHRIGSTGENITYYDLVAKGTIDRIVLNALKNKADLAKHIVDSNINPLEESEWE